MTNQKGLNINVHDRVEVCTDYEKDGIGTVLTFRTVKRGGAYYIREAVIKMDKGYIEYAAMDFNDHNHTFIERVIK